MLDDMDAWLAGMARIKNVNLLRQYFIRWNDDIHNHPKKEEIVQAFQARAREIEAEKARWKR